MARIPYPEDVSPELVESQRPDSLPEKYCHLVLVNGSYVAPEERGERVLEEGDHLAVWPPVAGG